MKSIVFVLTATVILIVGCGKSTAATTETASNSNDMVSEVSTESSTEEDLNVEKYTIGDTVSTDIAEFTLSRAELAVALNNEDFLTPKVYDAAEDEGNPYVAPVGKTLLSFDFCVKNTNRSSVNFVGSDSNAWRPNFNVKYNDETYMLKRINEQSFNLTETLKDSGNGYEKDASSNTILQAGEECKMRSVGLIDIEPKEDNPTFTVTVDLPSSDGSNQTFSFEVNNG